MNRRRRSERDANGEPSVTSASILGLIHDRCRWGRLGRYVWLSRRIRGWVRGREALELAKTSAGLPPSPVIVEVGSFLGCSTVLLAGARKLKGSGHVHCVDPFAASGDAFSAPIYRSIAASLDVSLRTQFERNLQEAGLLDWVSIHQTTAAEAARQWRDPIDLLFLDGDQSPGGAREAYLHWSVFLRPGAILAINNSGNGPHHDGHDGSLRLVQEYVRPPAYEQIRRVDAVTFAVRTAASSDSAGRFC